MSKIMASMNLFFIIVSSLISVAFFTLLERKLLSYIQIRKGPNKVGYLGIFQPFSDAIKLFSKTLFFLENSNLSFMIISPMFMFLTSTIMWSLMPVANYGTSDIKFGILLFFVISSISVYSVILIGWSANSKFCYMGTIRNLAQMISYEVSLFLILVSMSILTMSYNISNFKYFQSISPLLIMSAPIFIMWLVSCLAESNRSPFDFAESESELVSGFNVEYLGGSFALIFLAENLSLILLSILTAFFFLNLNFFSLIMSFLLLNFFFIWIRGTMPRFRYDLLMSLNWKIFLPMAISFMLWFLCFSSFFYL